jgi:hypothetical protein
LRRPDDDAVALPRRRAWGIFASIGSNEFDRENAPSMSAQLTDGGHPLAGKQLSVHVRIREVRDPTAAELQQDAAGAATTLH